MTAANKDIRGTILRLCRERGSDKTVCPSEVARALSADDWRELMQPVREVAAQLVATGEIDVTQGCEVVNIEYARGPIRLRWRGVGC